MKEKSAALRAAVDGGCPALLVGRAARRLATMFETVESRGMEERISRPVGDAAAAADPERRNLEK